MNIVKSLTNAARELSQGHNVESPADKIAAEDFLQILNRELIHKNEKIQVPPATVKRVAILGPKVSGKDKDAINACLPGLANCKAAVMAHTDTAAKKAWLAHCEELATKLANGEKIDKSDGWTKADFESDFVQKMEIAKRAGDIACEKLLLSLKTPVARFIQHADALAESVQSEEQERFAEFGIQYQVSDVVKSIRSVGNWARIKLPSRGQWAFDPQAILDFLNL
ncbi:MAG: hypothetical protein ABIQ35_14270 [Verrucomicrobiota bacterium]